MKKEYIEPEMETFELHSSQELLFSSNTNDTPTEDDEENYF